MWSWPEFLVLYSAVIETQIALYILQGGQCAAWRGEYSGVCLVILSRSIKQRGIIRHADTEPSQYITVYRQTPYTIRTLIGSKIADHSDVVVGAAPTTSSIAT